MAQSLRLLGGPRRRPYVGSQRGLKVMKFGGTSVGSLERLRQVVAITQAAAERHRVALVVSAASGVTDTIVESLGHLEEDRTVDTGLPAFLAARYAHLAGSLLSLESQARYQETAGDVLASLRAALNMVRQDGLTQALRDEVLATGERLSAPLVALALVDGGHVSRPFDAAEFIRTDATHGAAVVDHAATERCVAQWHASIDPRTVAVVTGFIGSTAAGHTTTLGRGGSDYSAALLAACLRADVLERWTDVDGLYTEDPRTNPDAERLSYLVLREAQAWNQAGRLGMHRKMLDPLVAADVPVHVRSTVTPDRPGTFIVAEETEDLNRAVGF